MKWQHCIAPSASLPECKDYPLDIVTKDIRFKHSPWFYKVALFSPPNTLYPSPSRVKWSNAQIVDTQHGTVRKNKKDTSFQSSSDLAPSLHTFFTRKRVACQNPLKARAPEKPRNDLGGLGKPVEKIPWKTAKKKRCIFHIFWGQWVYISYII